ncbi:MAG: polysaccharide biosynthesis/export family protein [Gemmatimonadaceae bacterium]
MRENSSLVRSTVRLVVAACLVMGASACASGPRGSYVWVNDYPAPAAAPGRYVIGHGDVLSVRVWDQDRLSGRVVVRSDGRISLPLLPDVVAAGRTTTDVADDVASQLRDSGLVVKPRVTVTVEESKPISVAVMGEVARAGTYTVTPRAGIAEALASAGGLTEFAHRDRIFVLRRMPRPVRIRFTYDAIARADGRAALFALQTGDVVVVE